MLRRAALLLLAALLIGACGSGDDSGGPSSGTNNSTGNDESNLEWDDCGASECATLTVPLDHAAPDGETIELALWRQPARGDRIGALLTNPGGPGVAGKALTDFAASYFSDDLLERFDIVSWDPRGVGESAAVDCVDSLDFFYDTDSSPDDQNEVDDAEASAQRLVDGCAERSGDLLPYLSTDATIRDLDLIRAALGEEKLTYIGFSYGTYIGALYADEFPRNVRAMVLDGAVDPSLDVATIARDQALGFDGALTAFLDDCASRECDFGGDDPHASYEQLMRAIDAEPLYAEVEGEERELGPGQADLGVATALYLGEDGWSYLEDALVEAAQGDGSALLSLADSYTGREKGGEYSNQTEAFYAIGCLDAPSPTGDEFAATADEIADVAPYFGAATMWLGAPCAQWPVPAAGTPHEVRAAGAPPIVVVGTTNDPATPEKWAESLAQQLESGVLLVWEAEGHTAYMRGSSCVDDAIDSYLINGDAPDDGTRC